jgi:hypothetical protein
LALVSQPLQQSLSIAQGVPVEPHVPHTKLPSQFPLQQSDPVLHALPSGLHGAWFCTQMPDRHLAMEMQSESLLQAASISAPIGGLAHTPFAQLKLAQSEAWLHDLPSAPEPIPAKPPPTV